MEGLTNLKTRINYAGGENQQTRMNNDKLRSLKKALLYSYQAATAILVDGRKFRCLINPDKQKNEYDNKIISIPFEDICLNKDEISGVTTNGIQKIGISAGDVFTWAENNTDWIVYLQRLEETAYFRAEIRRCKYTVEIENSYYKVYACGPSESNIDWRKVNEKEYNELNYSLEMYITKDEFTERYFHRFSIIKLNGKPWEVQAIDNMSVDGIIIVALKETYQNTIKEEIEEEKLKSEEAPNLITSLPSIQGEKIIYPYDEKQYTIIGAENGIWSVDNSKVEIVSQTSENVKLYINTGKSGNFILKYSREDADDIVMSITIDSL